MFIPMFISVPVRCISNQQLAFKPQRKILIVPSLFLKSSTGNFYSYCVEFCSVLFVFKTHDIEIYQETTEFSFSFVYGYSHKNKRSLFWLLGTSRYTFPLEATNTGSFGPSDNGKEDTSAELFCSYSSHIHNFGYFQLLTRSFNIIHLSNQARQHASNYFHVFIFPKVINFFLRRFNCHEFRELVQLL